MYKEKELLHRVIESMEIRKNSLTTVALMQEDGANAETIGAVKELEYQIKELYLVLDRIDFNGNVLFDHEIPF